MRRQLPRVRLLVAAMLALPPLVAAIDAVPVAVADSGFDLAVPGGAGRFGTIVTVLDNGNYVVADPLFDLAGVVDVGAVFLYDGESNQLISTLTGSQANDSVGVFVVPVGQSNFVAVSSFWANGAATRAGAATWIDGRTGLNGQVSAANSLVGTHTLDSVGYDTRALANGNYVVVAPSWDDGAIADAGAVIWGDGASGTRGPVSSANGLVGTTAGDRVGTVATVLSNGHYVVASPDWDDGVVTDAGAVTWANGAGGTSGPVTVANSLVGTTADDSVGNSVTALTNGNYVVSSPRWHYGTAASAGAATWRPGGMPTAGTVSQSNSLVGTTAGDNVGYVAALTNGNYIVMSQFWDNGGTANVGAVTWGDGTAGSSGIVGPVNSFVGAAANDGVNMSLRVLTNGSYVIGDPSWDDGAITDAGAVTWRPGTGPAPGSPSPAVSLVGTSPSDMLGNSIAPLANGNYAVMSNSWDNGGIPNAGAVTWGSGTAGVVGPVTTANSLVGSHPNDGSGANVIALTNGNYVATFPAYDESGVPDVGAVTWRPGDGPAPAVVSAANSLVGSTSTDLVGVSAARALPGGDFVVMSPYWDHGAVVDAGALTRLSGTGPSSGVVSASNSIVGGAPNDGAGFSIESMPDGSWVALWPSFDSVSAADAGAVTWVHGAVAAGTVGSANSWVGTIAGGGSDLNIAAEGVTAQRSLVVGRPAANRVTLIHPTEYVALAPARLADTRAGFATVDGWAAGTGVVRAGTTLDLAVAGRGGVAGDAQAAALNVTAVEATGSGYLTVFPCGSPRPLASNLNYTAGSIVPNAVVAKLGGDGHVCIYSSNDTNVVVDVNGFFPASTSYRSTNPARLLDTRPGEPTADGLQQGAGKLGQGAVVVLQVAGRAGVPGEARSVALNVTVTEPDGPGFITAYPCSVGLPVASNLNFVAGSTVANLVVSALDPNGRVCLYTSQVTHLLADLNGWFPTRTDLRAVTPARLLETRSGLSTVDGAANGGGLRSTTTVTAVQVTGRAGVPGTAGSVILNVTATEAAGGGYVTVYPCGIDPPLASNLNYTRGSTIPNSVVVKLGPGGQVCLFNSESTHLVVDVSGYIPA